MKKKEILVYKQAKLRAEREMDLIRFLKSQMLVSSFRRLMYTKLERYLM